MRVRSEVAETNQRAALSVDESTKVPNRKRMELRRLVGKPAMLDTEDVASDIICAVSGFEDASS